MLEYYSKSGEDVTKAMWISAVGYNRIPHIIMCEGIPIRYFRAVKLGTLFKVIVAGSILNTKEKKIFDKFVSEDSAGLPEKMPKSFYTNLSKRTGLNFSDNNKIQFSSNVYSDLSWSEYKVSYFQTKLLSTSQELSKSCNYSSSLENSHLSIDQRR
ncbi:MAG: hypothetical protein ACI9S8_000629 [Chlamydiales bacterium]|jgi:hypothetical protein